MGAFPVGVAGLPLRGVLKAESPGRWLAPELPSRLGERVRERWGGVGSDRERQGADRERKGAGRGDKVDFG